MITMDTVVPELRVEAMDSILDKIGNTPLVKLSGVGGRSSRFTNVQANLYAKVEFFNPTGSMKDRIAKHMIEQAEKRGDLRTGSTIVEATTGNAGISFSMVAAAKGYKMVVVMPQGMTGERAQMIRAYGAEIVMTPVDKGVSGAVEKAKELAKQPGWWMPAQFENHDNVSAHRETTGKEILQQIPEGKVDAFVASVGTGGTIMGVAQALRAVNPDVRIIAVQPAGSRELSGGQAGRHVIEGIADGFVPKIVDTSQINEVIDVRDVEAVRFCRILAAEKGFFCGVSSGCNVYGAMRVARSMRKGQNVVTMLPDSGDRYLSIHLFEGDAEKVAIPASCSPM
jgi:cysteine synthase A